MNAVLGAPSAIARQNSGLTVVSTRSRRARPSSGKAPLKFALQDVLLVSLILAMVGVVCAISRLTPAKEKPEKSATKRD